MSITTVKRERITFDPAVYPRFREHTQVSQRYAEAMVAGATFPPIEVDQNYRLIDGKHRLGAYDILGAPSIVVNRVSVKDDAMFFKLALHANATHGAQFTKIDYANMVLRGRELGMSSDQIAEIVHVTPGFLNTVTKDWFALTAGGTSVPLKRTIAHMGGKVLTEEQVDVNRKLGGQQPGFYVNQVRMLIETGLVDESNSRLMTQLQMLQDSLRVYLIGVEKRNGKGRGKAVSRGA